MFAFDTMNYSLRPNKAIQRQMVFDALELLCPTLPIRKSKYVGFGSVWFADFSLIHRRLGVEDMVSIEKDPVLYKRAVFNAPFRTVRVEEGDSTTILEAMLADDQAMAVPWIVWLDYTSFVTPEVVGDLDLLADRAPPNSVVLITVNVSARNYGAGLEERRKYLREQLGDVVPEQGDDELFNKNGLPTSVAEFCLAYLDARCKSFGRKPGFIPAFKIPYRDGAPMVTFGGILPDARVEDGVRLEVGNADWPGFPSVAVETPPLTMREAQALMQLLPTDGVDITRADVQRLGFDLEDDKLLVYLAHYRRYPSFFQTVG